MNSQDDNRKYFLCYKEEKLAKGYEFSFVGNYFLFCQGCAKVDRKSSIAVENPKFLTE